MLDFPSGNPQQEEDQTTPFEQSFLKLLTGALMGRMCHSMNLHVVAIALPGICWDICWDGSWRVQVKPLHTNIWEIPGLKLNLQVCSYSYPYPCHLGNLPHCCLQQFGKLPGAQYNLETVGPYARLHLTVHRASKLFLGFCPSWCLDLLTLIPSLKNMPPAALTADSLASKARARYMWNIWSLCGSVC